MADPRLFKQLPPNEPACHCPCHTKIQRLYKMLDQASEETEDYVHALERRVSRLENCMDNSVFEQAPVEMLGEVSVDLLDKLVRDNDSFE